MSREEKLLQRFLSFPKDFTYDETVSILRVFGFMPDNSGHTSGSRRRFRNEATGDRFAIHQPHPGTIVKRVYLVRLAKFLKEGGYLK